MSSKLSGRRIRLGMVGGGQGALIGNVHRIAARIDDEYVLVAGALSSDPQRAAASAREIGIDDERSYANFADMAAAEAAREDGIEVVAVVTPNHLHHPIAKAFLDAGIHVICDKPLTVTSEQSRELIDAAARANRILAVTYNYSGYPMIRQARAMVASGELGNIRLVQAEYAQDWLADAIEQTGQKQAAWRTDPAKSGAGGCIGDIGTHAYQLATFVTGLTLESLCADLSRFVEGRRLDDNAALLLRFKGGAKGMLWASQVAVGNENGLSLRVYGDKGGLSWRQEAPNELWFTTLGGSAQRITRGGAAAGADACRMSRIPAGHPEGYLEAFASIYTEIAAAIRAHRDGSNVDAELVFPAGEDGLKGVAFVEAAVRSSESGAGWVAL
ncbi:MAG: Gfo/Idh/MocA family oxidoreductase [Proteobacteria bacterium]|nr:Gfo/Idh/MocA family oxidoreductase [Pseudomonadota bacterium]MDA1063853.1 Gfo/Idh/MocA family oxidoreductase [Pseudomonadota bacterium]